MSIIDKYPGQNYVIIPGRDLKITDFWFDSTNFKQTKHAQDLLKFAYANPEWVWERPSHRQPWLWTTKVMTPNGYILTLSCWPHKGRWLLEGFPVEETWDGMKERLRVLLREHDTGSNATVKA
jgi:hypothetical protein